MTECLQQEVVVKVKVEEESPAYKQVEGRERRAGRRPFREQARRMGLDGNYNYSLWGIEENAAYMRFLDENYGLFERSNSDRRLMKINVLMSLWVKTRSPDQCRSHHQKMMKYHQDIPSIIAYIRTCLGLVHWDQWPKSKKESQPTICEY
jgi:hypothetical protein